MKKKILINFFLLATTLNANQNTIYSTENLSLGNIQNNNNYGSQLFYNPASISNNLYKFNTEFNVNLSMRDEDFLTINEVLKDINFNKFKNQTSKINLLTEEEKKEYFENYNNILKILKYNNKNVKTTLNLNTILEYKNFAISINQKNILKTTLKTYDKKDLIITEDNINFYKYDLDLETYVKTSEKDYNDNSLILNLTDNSYLNRETITITEIPLTFAKEFRLINNDKLSIGSSIKLMNVISTNENYNFENLSDISNINKNIDKKIENKLLYDIGLIYKPRILDIIKIGISGRNINKQTFILKSGNKYLIDREIKGNLIITPNKYITASLSGDFVQYKIDEEKNKNIAAGIQFKPFKYFNINFGIMKNIAYKKYGYLYSGGINIGGDNIKLNISGQMSNKTIDINDNTIPQYANLGIGLTIRF